MSIRPLIVDWKGLKKMGWPYSRMQTQRLMQDEVERSRCIDRESGAREYWIIPNPDPFPKCYRVNNASPHSRVVWRVVEVLAYFEAHSLSVTEDWYAS